MTAPPLPSSHSTHTPSSASAAGGAFRRLSRRRDGARRSSAGAAPIGATPAPRNRLRACLTVTGRGSRPAIDIIRAAGGRAPGTGRLPTSTNPAAVESQATRPRSIAITRSAAARQRSRRCSAEHDRRTVVLVQAPQLPQQLLGGNRVQLRCGLVQQQQPGPRGKRGGERHALQLTTGQGPDRALEQVGDAECQRRFLDRARERRTAHAAALERQLDLRTHAVHDGLCLRVLEARG